MDKNKRAAYCFIVSVIFLCIFLNGHSALAQEEAQEEAKKTVSQPLIEKGGILLKKGQFQIEPSILYSHFSKNRIVISGFSIFEAILIGRIYAEDAERDTILTSLTTRYGLLNNTELELRIPLRYRRDEVIVIADNRETTNDRFGIGDIEAAIYHQVLYEQGRVPDVVLNLQAKSRTGEDPYGLATDEVPLGTGHWGVKGGLTVSKTNDPVIIFGTLGYFWNIERDVAGENWDPGNTVEYGIGLAYALNPQISLNTRIEHRLTGKTERDGEEFARSQLNVATLYSGFTYAISENLAFDLTVGAGLTEDSPDFVLQLRMPYTF